MKKKKPPSLVISFRVKTPEDKNEIISIVQKKLKQKGYRLYEKRKIKKSTSN